MNDSYLNPDFSMDYKQENGKKIYTLDAKSPRILLIEDIVSVAQPVNNVFLELGCLPDMAFCGTEAKELYMRNKYDLMILDWSLPDTTGGDLLANLDRMIANHKLNSSSDAMPVILFTGMNAQDLNMEITNSKNFQIIDHWQKPMKMKDIIRGINKNIDMLF